MFHHDGQAMHSCAMIIITNSIQRKISESTPLQSHARNPASTAVMNSSKNKNMIPCLHPSHSKKYQQQMGSELLRHSKFKTMFLNCSFLLRFSLVSHDFLHECERSSKMFVLFSVLLNIAFFSMVSCRNTNASPTQDS